MDGMGELGSTIADDIMAPMMEELCCVSPTIMSGGQWVEE